MMSALSIAVSAAAQGTVNFTTRSGASVNAPVTLFGGRLASGTGDDAVFGQLYAAAPGATLAAVGNPVPFRSDLGVGYITAGGTVDIPGTTVGGTAHVKLVAWYARQGASYADAIENSRGGGYGESPVVTVNGLGGGITPPALLVGLQGFGLFFIPEPSISALGLLGAGLLLICRKKSNNEI